MRQYWEPSLNNWYTRHITFKIISIQRCNNGAYFTVAPRWTQILIKVWGKKGEVD